MAGLDRSVGVSPFPAAAGLLAAHAAALPQPDQLCGPFAARLAVAALTDLPVPEVAAFARAAGTAVWPHDVPDARPPGAPPHTDAWDGVARAGTPEAAGTSAPGVGRAVTELSGGALAAVPATGDWTAGRLSTLLDALRDAPVVVLANVLTGEFRGAGAPVAALERFLDTGDDAVLPGPDWSVGHFVVLYGRRDGSGGMLLAVADTYPQLGDRGRHLQPVGRVAAALARDRPRSGGLVLVTPAGGRDAVAGAVRDAGLEVGWWDNGTPDAGRPGPGLSGPA